MAQLRQDYKIFVERQAEVIVIGPEDASNFKNFWQQENMPITGIADPQHIIAGLYGQEVKVMKLGRMPALFIIDKKGLVRFSHHGNSMSDIPPNIDVLNLLEKLNKENEK